jgi:hypothetical protein
VALDNPTGVIAHRRGGVVQRWSFGPAARRARGQWRQELGHGGGGSHGVGGVNRGLRGRGPACSRMGRLLWTWPEGAVTFMIYSK